MQAFSRLAARATFHLLKSIYYLLAPLVKRDRGWEGRDGGGGAKREAERERAMDVSNSSPLLSREWKSCWHRHEYFSR